METNIDPKAFEFAVTQIDNGFVFEKFASAFLAQIEGVEFVPVGGLKDRGIDGLEHLFHPKGVERSIYQHSIESNAVAKITRTLDKLSDNGITFDHFYYVTNAVVPEQDMLIDAIFDKYKKALHIRDLKWLSLRVGTNQGTINAYGTFIRSYLHEYCQPGKSYVVGDLIDDPRLFVFLRQQWDHNQESAQLDTIVADSLILFALEGTDPDAGIFRTREEVKQTIAGKIKFDPKVLYGTIDRRLEVLSKKPRRIKHHQEIDAYCLPYETRLEIQQRNLEDAQLYSTFQDQSQEILARHLKDLGVRVKDCLSLMEAALNLIYYQQGLEFAAFVLKGENQDAFEKNLEDTIAKVVDSSPVVEKNREDVKSALMMTIREIAYNGSKEQKSFLSKLSNTYLMLFLLQCDPKLGLFFSSMASQMTVFVCTSIIVPAMSEYLLEPENRRHWNLLKGAKDAGVRLVVTKPILKELVGHFRRIVSKYDEFYKDDEAIYLGDEIQLLYVDEILIRSYFYAKTRGKAFRFHDFIDNFVTPSLEQDQAEGELTEWLKEEFGIRVETEGSLDVTVDESEFRSLHEVLKKHKSAAQKSEADARVILTVYALRERKNETGTSGIFGYRTWWLSKDTSTMKAVNEVFKEKHFVSCYMRPDFLYNYVSLSPRPAAIKETYAGMFPSLLGVNISYHLPPDIVHAVQKSMKEHRAKNTARRGAILRTLCDKLRMDVGTRARATVEHYLDEQLRKIEVEIRPTQSKG